MTAASMPNEALRAAIDELVTIHAEILVLSERTDEGWRRALIALRRRLQQQILLITQLLDAIDAEIDEARRLRGALGRMRSVVALHQANWPAVAIDRIDPGYQESIRDVRAANKDFIELVGLFLTRPPQPDRRVR